MEVDEIPTLQTKYGKQFSAFAELCLGDWESALEKLKQVLENDNGGGLMNRP